MVDLFLSDPAWGNVNVHDDSNSKRQSLLDELELVIWSLMSSSGRSEARLWLCNTLSSIHSISPRRQKDLFISLLRSKPINRNLASQLLHLIFEKQPHKAGPIIAKKSHKLEKFFEGNPRRIMQWFSSFCSSADSEHINGAKALSQFAFVNRDTCWEELEWKGKHGQSPAMVATKPHYFLDLDVQRTVENFLEYVPEFWSSREFSESLKDGNILSVDAKFFVNLFMDLMYKEEREEVWDVIEEFLLEQSFSFLCHHLLIILEEKDFTVFLDLIPKYLKVKAESVDFGDKLQWFEVILSKYSNSSTVDEILLLNAVTNQGRQLLRLVHEEGSNKEKEKIKNLVSKLCEPSDCVNDLVPIIVRGVDSKPFKLIKMLCVQSWVIQFKLAEEVRTRESWEYVFTSNRIKFRKSDKYALLLDDECSEDYGSDCDGRYSKSRKAKKHKKCRKKRRRSAESYEDKLDDFNSKAKLDLQSTAGDWLLSTDGFSATWSTVDLPEHLSQHCLLTWLKWVFSKWRLVD